MIEFKALFFLIITVSLIGCKQTVKPGENDASRPATTVNNAPELPLVLPDGLEPDRQFFESAISRAHAMVVEFASKYNWEQHTSQSFMDSAIIYGNKTELDRKILKLTNSDPSLVLPGSFVAGLEGRILTVISPELYLELVPQVEEDNYYEKLIAHEIFHRLHIRILNGDEDAMGPFWVFEGFATYASNQFSRSTMQLTNDEIWEIVASGERGSYETYRHVFSYFVDLVTLPELLARAGDEDFITWLKEKENESIDRH